MGNAAFASYSVFSTIPGLSVARKTLIFQCFQKYRYLTSAFERPDWKRLIADIEAGKVGIVLVKDLSRVGRDYLRVGFYTEVTFPQNGVASLPSTMAWTAPISLKTTLHPFSIS